MSWIELYDKNKLTTEDSELHRENPKIFQSYFSVVVVLVVFNVKDLITYMRALSRGY